MRVMHILNGIGYGNGIWRRNVMSELDKCSKFNYELKWLFVFGVFNGQINAKYI